MPSNSIKPKAGKTAGEVEYLNRVKKRGVKPSAAANAAALKKIHANLLKRG